MRIRGRANLEEDLTATKPLGNRELQCLQLLSEGLTVREIGAELYLSEHTIKVYLGRIYKKLEVTGQTHAVAKACRMGLL